MQKDMIDRKRPRPLGISDVWSVSRGVAMGRKVDMARHEMHNLSYERMVSDVRVQISDIALSSVRTDGMADCAISSSGQ